MGKSTPIAYTEERLRQTLALNAVGVTIPTLIKAFGLKEEDKATIRDSLEALVTEGFAVKDKKNSKYHAVHPMSDVVIARVGKSLTNKSISLKIQGTPEDFPFPVSMNLKSLKRILDTNSLQLQVGELIAVNVHRHDGTQLKARPLGKFKGGKSPMLVGHFNERKAEPTFIPYSNLGIQTEFKAVGKIPEDRTKKQSYLAHIPLDLDPFNPVLKIGEQKWDPETGFPIAKVIAEKHGVEARHTQEARQEAHKIIEAEHDIFTGRRDLTHEPILVIDPADARDHDDGIMIERTQNGYRTLVVIADVPFYVRSGSLIDQNAKERGFTHYFPDDTFHQLPPKLAEFASLKEGAPKPVIYVEQFWDEFGKQISIPEIGAGVIASQKQKTYGEFEDLVHDEDLSPSIHAYTGLGDPLIEKMRYEKGLTFDTTGLDQRAPYSQALVAAMMIEANSAIAEFLQFENQPYLSRSHTGADNIEAFLRTKERLEDLGCEVPDHIGEMTPGTINRILANSDPKQQIHIENLIRTQFLHRAIYTTQAYRHYGLDRENYTHATSPIRRYADILTLRSVHTALRNYELGLSDDESDQMNQIAAHLNNRQDISRRMANDSQKYYAIRALFHDEGKSMSATIGRIQGDFVEIVLGSRFGLRKQIQTSALPENWSLGRDHKSLIYNGNIFLRENDSVKLRIRNVQPHLASWDFDSLEPPEGARRRPILRTTPFAVQIPS